MWLRILMVAACLTLAVGCAKKIAKKPSQDDSGNAKAPTPAPRADDRDRDRDRKNDKKGEKGNEPNWLTDPRFKKEKEQEQPSTPQPPQGGATGKESWGIAPPQGGWEGPNPNLGPIQPAAPGGVPLPGPGLPVVPGGPPPGPMGLGGVGIGAPGAVPPPPPPPGLPGTPGLPPTQNKRVEVADMKEVWIYIENASGAGGKMPTQKMIYDALVSQKSPAAELVRSGAIYLTGATSRESVWAFETQAITNGGLVATQNGVETLTAAELKQRLGK